MARRRLALITTALAVATFVAGCDSGYHYVKSSEDKTYFKVPSEWRLYDEEDVIAARAEDLSADQQEAIADNTWRVAFDAAPSPSLVHVRKRLTNHPAGEAFVVPLSADDADVISTQALRNLFVDVDTAVEDGSGDVLDYEPIELDGGFRGVHVVVAVANADGKAVVYDQTALVDQSTTKLYALLVTCSISCYDANRGKIESIIDSWTVREK